VNGVVIGDVLTEDGRHRDGVALSRGRLDDRDVEAAAATSSIRIDALNAISRPCRNGSEISAGKNDCP
jgi:hypothetical protein